MPEFFPGILGAPVVINDHYPFWDSKPYGNPFVGYAPGTEGAGTYTGFFENRKAWVDFIKNPVAVSPPPRNESATGLSIGPIPNPATGLVEIPFWLAREGKVRLDVFDIRGRLVSTLEQTQMPSGNYRSAWNTEPHSAGMYFVRLSASSGDAVRKVIVID